MAYNLLKGKKGIITGAMNEQSIAWKVAEKAYEEGAELVLTNTALSLRLGTLDKLAEKTGSLLVPADATSVEDLSFHKLLQTLYKKDALNRGGSIVALTYIAGDRAMPGYGDMADAKAMLQSIMRNFGMIYGRDKGVRVNTVSQSPTMTTAGQGISGLRQMYDYVDSISPLGNASAEDCADYVVTLFSDLTRKVTLQNLYNDGGFSSLLPFPYQTDH